ncbi:MAG: GGDEF domain-containing protein [Oscillospiraceae bacterium]|nr:GGDEF domain-containing protein [Oscillospiraceae bacterium]
MGRSKKNKKRLHFGVLISTIFDACQCAVWNGICDYAEANDIHLTAYIGTHTTHTEYAPHYDTCFNAIKNNTSLDGIILFTGFFAHNISLDEINYYIDSLPKTLPMVSISYTMPGIPSVVTENTSGIYDAVDHLIKIHGKSKIAFIKGPDGHPEAEERFDGYKKALADNAIKFDKNYVFPGDFSRTRGEAAAKEMYDKRKITVDAVVASDDETAIGVLGEFRERGILVPTEVAVTGFDDDRESATFLPSISTARQDFFEIGAVSTKLLVDKLNGKKVEELIYVSPVFIARQSCGCVGNFTNIYSQMDDNTENIDSLFAFTIKSLTNIFNNIIPQSSICEWTTEIINAITNSPFSKKDFLVLFDELLINYSYYSKDFDVWHEVLNTLTLGVEMHHDEVECAHSILSAIIMATSLINETCLREKIRVDKEINESHLIFRRSANSFVSLFDINLLIDELHHILPELLLDTALIGIYKNPIKSGTLNADRAIETVIGFDGNKKIKKVYDEKSSEQFTDFGAIDGFDFNKTRRTFYNFPLFFIDDEMGVLLIPYDAQITTDEYEALRLSISTAIKGAQLISKIQALSITDELTGLLNRRGFFQFSYSRLQHMRRSSEGIPIVMFMDMDGLKYINDTFGHQEGDIAISVLARILKETLREEDIIGRMGGDEFVVLSLIKTKDDGVTLIKRIRDSLDSYNDKKHHPYKVSASIGSIILMETSNECFESAVLSADSVMYEEKKAKKAQGLSRK